MRSKWFLGALILALLATLYVQLPAIQDLYRIDDDFRQYFWMARFQDPGVFPNDPMVRDVKGVHVVNILGLELIVQFESLGFSLLYQLASYLVIPLVFNKVLPFILIVICVVYFFPLGRSLTSSDPLASFLVLFFVMYSLSASPNISLTSGLERSFQFVLLFMFLYYLIGESSIGMVITLAVQVLFYAPMFIVSVMVYVLSLLRWERRRLAIDLRVRRILPLFIGVTLAVLILLPALLDSQTATASLGGEGEQVPVWRNPTYGPDGRVPIFPESFSGFPLFLLVGYGGLARVDNWWHMAPLMFLVVIILVCVGTESLRLDWHIHALLLGSLAAWSVAWLVTLLTGHFVLRYPFKYTSAPLPLWMLLYCGLNTTRFLGACVRIFRSKSRWWLVVWVVGAISLLGSFFVQDMLMAVLAKTVGALAFIVGAAGLLLWRMRQGTSSSRLGSDRLIRIAGLVYAFVLLLVFVPRMKSYTVSVSREERPVLNYVSALPKDVLIAGDPEVMSNIPLFAQRSVFLSSEISYVGEERIEDFFRAYYADRPEDVYAFCEKYGVNYLVVNRGHFLDEYLARGNFFYAPYNGYVVDYVAGRKDFFLASISEDEVVFDSGPWFVWLCLVEN